MSVPFIRIEAMEYLHQAYSKRRWENQEAEHLSLRNLDRGR